MSVTPRPCGAYVVCRVVPSQCRWNEPRRSLVGSSAENPPNQQSSGALQAAASIRLYGSGDSGAVLYEATTLPSLKWHSEVPSPTRGLLGAVTVQNSRGPAIAI